MSSAFNGTVAEWVREGHGTEEEFDAMLVVEGRCWWCYMPLEGDGTDRTFVATDVSHPFTTHAKCGHNVEGVGVMEIVK